MCSMYTRRQLTALSAMRTTTEGPEREECKDAKGFF